MSDWDDDDDVDEGVLQAIEDFARLTKQRDTLNEKIEALMPQILHEFDDEIGEQTKVFSGNVVTVKIPERWSWNSDQLEEIFKDSPLPKYAKRRYSMDKRSFTKLTHEEKEPYLDALTRSPGVAKISVSEKEN